MPEILDLENEDSPSTIASELHTAVHEFAHVFGCCSPGTTAADTPFIDAAGDPVDPLEGNVYIVDPGSADGYPRPSTRITTPRVLNTSRAYFDCPTLNGVPLEDMALGKGAHWEARVLGACAAATGRPQLHACEAARCASH